MRNARLSVLVAVTLLAACSSKQPQTADESFERATHDFRRGSFTQAIKQYRELLDRHPFSDYAEEAELRIAHAHFLASDYTAAVVTLTDFQRRHPTSEHLPLVGYLLGMCYARQMGTIDRDQTAAQSAHSYFATLVQQYPESPFADLARIELAKCRQSLADHELAVADFYAKRGNADASQVRLLSLASRYSETSTAADALLRLIREYVRKGNQEHAVLATRALEALHPESKQSLAARGLVDKVVSASVPPTTDPLDLLVISSGRRREEAAFALPKVPALGEKRTRQQMGAPSMPRSDPFGRGSTF